MIFALAVLLSLMVILLCVVDCDYKSGTWSWDQFQTINCGLGFGLNSAAVCS